MVECHRNGMEASAAVDARFLLQVSHQRDELRLARSLLKLSAFARSRVVSRIPDSPAVLAPTLNAASASMKVRQGFRDPAERADPSAGREHAAMLEHTFSSIKEQRPSHC
jgi:hypothetical protein